MTIEFIVESLKDTDRVGQEIAKRIEFPACIYLHGDMGTGKTTLTRSILKGLGYVGAVTSPTYNLIQEYSVEQGIVYHMDLYRVSDPSELEFLAIDDLWSEKSVLLVEWPQLGAHYLPPATSQISLNIFFDEGIQKRKIILDL